VPHGGAGETYLGIIAQNNRWLEVVLDDRRSEERIVKNAQWNFSLFPFRYSLPCMPRDYYDILGVSRSETEEDIKKAYRRLSKELHPDKHKGDKRVEQRFKEINEAYEVLGNFDKRKAYDQFGHARVGTGGFDFSGFSGANVGDIGNFGDLFEAFFGGQRSGRRATEERGRDLEIRVRISFEECVRGTEKALSLQRMERCSECDGNGTAKGAAMVSCEECGGTGQLTRTVQSFFGSIRQNVLCGRCRGAGKVPERLCPRCEGEGRSIVSAVVNVRIPAAIHHGQTVRLKGQGEAGRRGAAAGDLFVQVDVILDPRFTRDGDDIRSTATLTIFDALLGGEVAVDTVQGSVRVSLASGTQPGQVIRLKDKGMPMIKGRGHGDHYVTLDVDIPRKMSREERRLIEEWRRLHSV
jgi:molecular chaperone DnaJ